MGDRELWQFSAIVCESEPKDTRVHVGLCQEKHHQGQFPLGKRTRADGRRARKDALLFPHRSETCSYVYLRKHRQALSEHLPCVLYKRYYHELIADLTTAPRGGFCS